MQSVETIHSINREFKVAKGWAIFIYIFMPPMTALFIVMGIIPFVTENFSWLLVAILVPMSIGLTSLMVLGLLETIKSRFIINEDRVISITPFKTKELKISEIKGYRMDQNYIHIVPKSNDLPKIKISQYYGNRQELDRWLYSNFLDLDLVESAEDENEILENIEYGFTTEQRERKLKSARSFARILNIIGGSVGLWLFFYPFPYNLCTGIALLFPFLSLIGLIVYKGLIRLDQKKNSGYPSLFTALIMPPMGLLLRGILDFELLEYDNIWLPVGLISVFFVFGILFITKELKFKRFSDFFTLFGLLAFMFGYSYGSVVNINCVYDNSEAKFYQVEVLNKRISSGKSTSYYLELEEWGPKKEVDEVSVSKSLYNRVEMGETVNVYLMSGKLNIPWYFVRSKK